MPSFDIKLETLDTLNEIIIPGPQARTAATEFNQWIPVLYAAGGASGHRLNDVGLFQWTIDLPNLRDVDFAALEAFYATVGGNRDAFNYTHTDGLVYESRFLKRFEHVRLSTNQWQTSLVLLMTDEPQVGG